MVEKITRTNVSELQRVRLSCNKCQSVVEVPASHLCKNNVIASCPQCSSAFFSGISSEKNPLVLLDEALATLKNAEGTVSVSFEWPE